MCINEKSSHGLFSVQVGSWSAMTGYGLAFPSNSKYRQDFLTAFAIEEFVCVQILLFIVQRYNKKEVFLPDCQSNFSMKHK
jgi:hypothetical protein